MKTKFNYYMEIMVDVYQHAPVIFFSYTRKLPKDKASETRFLRCGKINLERLYYSKDSYGGSNDNKSDWLKFKITEAEFTDVIMNRSGTLTQKATRTLASILDRNKNKLLKTTIFRITGYEYGIICKSRDELAGTHSVEMCRRIVVLDNRAFRKSKEFKDVKPLLRSTMPNEIHRFFSRAGYKHKLKAAKTVKETNLYDYINSYV